MNTSRNMSLNIRNIPVFVFPNSLKFYLQTKTSYKQLLTLYNPYDFPVRFKVLCTAPSKYSVIDPEGSIGPHMSVDIIVRHTAPVLSNCNIVDKFRISMQDHSSRQEKILGKRDIESVLLQSERPESSLDGDFQDLPYAQRSNTSDDQRIFSPNRGIPANSSYKLAVVVGLFCVLSLLLPTQQETPQPSSIPSYLHLSINVKLVLSYVLGLVSMVVFRT